MPADRPRLLRLAARWGQVAALLAVLAGIVVRLTAGSLEGVGAILYHALPPGLVAVAALAAAGLSLLGRDRGRAIAWTAVAGLLGVWHVAAGWVVAPERHFTLHDAPTRLVLWNTQHGAGGLDDVAADLRSLHADVICLVEGAGDSPEERAFWAAELPEHEAAYFGSGLIVLAKGGIGESRRVDLRRHGKGAVIVVGELTLLLFDVKQGALRSRAPVFDGLEPLIESLRLENLVVLGDFNTPRDSVYFRRWRGRLAHAFEAAGGGYDATWPVPLPLLCLDHVWTAPSVEVLSCRLGWSLDSDHRPVIVELRAGGG